MTESNAETPNKESWASRNRRHLIAVCMIVLMLAFLVPSQLPNLTRSTNPVIGQLDGKPIRRMETHDAANRWYWLKHIVVPGQRGNEPLVNQLLDEKLVLSLDRHPEAYMLLLKEAYEDGPGGSDQVVSQLVRAGTSPDQPEVLVALEDGRVVGFENLDEDYAQRYRLALADLLAIMNRYSMFDASVKPSAPLVERRLAAAIQNVVVQIMDFRSQDYLERVPEPTQEQVQAQFKRYASNTEGQVTPDNPFGFGYRIPNRVKLQAIQIPTSAVRELVRKSNDKGPDRDDPSLPYYWVVEAYKYYREHPSEFIPESEDSSTQPASQPTTASTEPTPFPEVRKELVERLINQQTTRTIQQIQQRIRTRMEGDYQVWKTNREMKLPTTQSSFGVPFESIDYFNAVVADVEGQFNIHMATANYDDRFFETSDLLALPGLGQSAIRMVSSKRQQQVVPFAMYAVQFYVPMIDAPEMDDWSAYWLEPFELSEMVEEVSGDENKFLFRVIAHEPSHVPNEIDGLKSRVERDWKRAEALKLAKADADAALKTIAESKLFTSPTTRPAIRNLTLSFREAAPPALELERSAGQQFMEKASNALLDASLQGELLTFEVPLADRVYLVRRDRIEPAWNSEPEFEQARAQVSGVLKSVLVTPNFLEPELAANRRMRNYFDIKNIFARNNFVPRQEDEEQAASQPSK